VQSVFAFDVDLKWNRFSGEAREKVRERECALRTRSRRLSVWFAESVVKSARKRSIKRFSSRREVLSC
jgi:hypothetical protein